MKLWITKKQFKSLRRYSFRHGNNVVLQLNMPRHEHVEYNSPAIYIEGHGTCYVRATYKNASWLWVDNKGYINSHNIMGE